MMFKSNKHHLKPYIPYGTLYSNNFINLSHEIVIAMIPSQQLLDS